MDCSELLQSLDFIGHKISEIKMDMAISGPIVKMVLIFLLASFTQGC